MNQERLWGGRLCSGNKRVRYTLVPRGGCNWLVSMIVWAGREVKPIRLRTRGSVAGPVGEARKGAFPI